MMQCLIIYFLIGLVAHIVIQDIMLPLCSTKVRGSRKDLSGWGQATATATDVITWPISLIAGLFVIGFWIAEWMRMQNDDT